MSDHPHCPGGDKPVGKIIPGQHEAGEVRPQWTLKADTIRAHLDLEEGRKSGGTPGIAESYTLLQHPLGSLLPESQHPDL